MSPETMPEGQIITATYQIGQNVSEEEARELLRSNAPSGFDVQNVELTTEKESNN